MIWHEHCMASPVDARPRSAVGTPCFSIAIARRGVERQIGVKFSVPGTPETNGAISAVAEVVHPRRWIQLTSYVRGQTSGGFGTNLLLMLVGTALGQAASVLLSPALTRIYTPDQFGYLGVYAAVLTILGVVAALGIDQAIPIASSIDELANFLPAAPLRWRARPSSCRLPSGYSLTYSSARCGSVRWRRTASWFPSASPVSAAITLWLRRRLG